MSEIVIDLVTPPQSPREDDVANAARILMGMARPAPQCAPSVTMARPVPQCDTCLSKKQKEILVKGYGEYVQLKKRLMASPFLQRSALSNHLELLLGKVLEEEGKRNITYKYISRWINLYGKKTQSRSEEAA